MLRTIVDDQKKQEHGVPDEETPELTEAHFERAIHWAVCRRLMRGEVKSGKDVSDLRRYLGMTQEQFATASRISVWTLRGWEQGRRHPEGPALALLAIAARHPRIFREALARSAA